MEKATIENMELGNLIFGTSRGEYSIPRQEYQDVFIKFLNQINADEYGTPYWGPNYDKRTTLFNNDIFVIRPYYWGDDDSIAELPNFEYKPENIEIRWYKYALRDAYCNVNLSLDEFKSMLDKCVETYNSLYERMIANEK